MTAELQRVSNGPDQVLIEEAYMAGYLEAVTVWGGNSNFYGGGS